MRYHIERIRRTRYTVVDRTGTRHSTHPNFEAAARTRESLSEAARLAHGPSQSTLYRRAASDPDLKQAATVLRELKAQRDPRAATIASYRRAMQWLGCDPDQAEAAMRRSIRHAAARVAVAAKRRKHLGSSTRARVLALTTRGIRQIDIAAQLQISTRMVGRYQAENRNQRFKSFPTGHALEYSAEHSPNEAIRT